MIVKSVVRLPETNAVEARWVNQILIPAQGSEGEEGYSPERIEEVSVKWQFYHQSQMDLLRADLGADAANYEDVFQAVEDNYIPPPPPVVVIPQSVSPRQIRQALTRFNLRAQVEAAIAAADQDTKDWYEFATAFERTHPAVLALATALNVTENDLDALWSAANAL